MPLENNMANDVFQTFFPLSAKRMDSGRQVCMTSGSMLSALVWFLIILAIVWFVLYAVKPNWVRVKNSDGTYSDQYNWSVLLLWSLLIAGAITLLVYLFRQCSGSCGTSCAR